MRWKRRGGKWDKDREWGKNGILVGYKKSALILSPLPLPRALLSYVLDSFLGPFRPHPFLITHLPFREGRRFYTRVPARPFPQYKFAGGITIPRALNVLIRQFTGLVYLPLKR